MAARNVAILFYFVGLYLTLCGLTGQDSQSSSGLDD